MKRCEKCFYSPELCGAKTEEDCEKQYQNERYVKILLVSCLVVFVFALLFIAQKFASLTPGGF